MEQLFIGELIRQRRLELGLKQCELCEGICEPVTMSRLESGKQTPGSNKLRMLMQRLGLPEERYYALVSKNELRISELQTEIVSSNVLHDSLRGLEKIEELEAIAEPNDNQVRQFILRSRAILGKLVDGKVEPYSLEEKLEMLLKQSGSPHLTLISTISAKDCTALMRSRLSTKLPISIPSKANVNKRFKFLFS